MTNCRWMHESGNTQFLEGMLHLAKSICEELPERDIVDLLSDIYHGLGGLANETNRGEDCLKYNECLVDLRMRNWKPGDLVAHRTAVAYNQRGTGHMMLKDYDKAIEDFKQSRTYFKDVPLDEPCLDSMPTVNMAVAYWLLGDLHTADTLLLDGLAAREKAFGRNDSVSFRSVSLTFRKHSD